MDGPSVPLLALSSNSSARASQTKSPTGELFGTEHVRGDPALAQRADVLGRAFEDGRLLGEAEQVQL